VGNHGYIKGAAELWVIARREYHAYQRRIGEAVIALAEARGLAGDSRPELWESLVREATESLYVAGEYDTDPG